MLAEKLKKYAEDYDLSDIHIRSNQPIAIRVMVKLWFLKMMSSQN